MATYYIDPSGNDSSGTGAIGSPWKSLFKATSTAVTVGDVIHVNAGTYTETVQSNLRVGVSIEGAGRNITTIKSTLNTAQVEIISARSGVEGTFGNQHISGIAFDGDNLTTSWAITIFARSNFQVYDCKFDNFKDSGVLFIGRVTFDGFEPTTYATGNSFHDNITNNCSIYESFFGRGHLWFVGQKDGLIYNNNMTQNQRPIGLNGWLIKCLNFTKNIEIYNNVLTKIPFHGNYGGDGGWDFAIEMADEQGVHIHHNIIQGSIDLNRQTKGIYAYSAWVHDNIISQPVLNTKYESGIIFEYGTDTAIIEDNVIINTASGLQFNTRNGDTVNNITIRRNKIVNVGIQGLDGNNGSFIIISSEGSPLNVYNLDGFNVYNNTFHSSPGNAINYGFELGNLVTGYERNINIKNNIIMNTKGPWITSNSVLAITNLVIQYNDLYNNGNSGNPLFAGTPPGSGYINSNNLSVNPLFVGSGSYLLQSGSPLIDAGVNVGLPYSGSAPDIGYAEFSSGNASPIVSAGPDQVINYPGTSTAFSGNASDPDGSISSTLWTQISGPNTAVITSPALLSSTVTGMVSGVYTFRLTATDNVGATGYDDVQITVNSGVVPGTITIKRKVIVLV